MELQCRLESWDDPSQLYPDRQWPGRAADDDNFVVLHIRDRAALANLLPPVPLAILPDIRYVVGDMINGDYSNLFFSGLRVMAQARRRSSSTATTVPPSPILPTEPEAEGSGDAFKVGALKSLLHSRLLRRTAKKNSSAKEKKAKRRRTLPSPVAPEDMLDVWIAEKSPLAQDTTAALLQTGIEEADRLKLEALDPSSPLKSFVITLTDSPIAPTSPGPKDKDESFLSISASSTESPFSMYGQRRRERPVSMPVPLRITSHPYRMDMEAAEKEGGTDNWEMFGSEWVVQDGGVISDLILYIATILSPIHELFCLGNNSYILARSDDNVIFGMRIPDARGRSCPPSLTFPNDSAMRLPPHLSLGVQTRPLHNHHVLVLARRKTLCRARRARGQAHSEAFASPD
ncbi:hypothetical protein EW146_g9074 [Bondarzewia mesenterica]|uniref:Uncharacterized protein n=1 Tax=Bondarzewia mesenterica TaxID=1095465 RepID=A0A4S4LB67_9AGAM|nr:hypothetical protein EW146_g9074 [Bondarzewia mesenterica]